MCPLRFQHECPCCHSNIFVDVYFHNWHEFHYKLNCPCLGPGDCTTVTGKYDDELSGFVTSFTFPINPETLHFHVSMAESKLGLPDYVTPGVWTYIKEYLWSIFERHVNFGRRSGYKMVVKVDISIIHLCDHNNILDRDNQDNDNGPKYTDVRGLPNGDDILDDEVFYDALDKFEEDTLSEDLLDR